MRRLRVIKGTGGQSRADGVARAGEDRYRFPVDEEIWEVSCDDRQEPARKPALRSSYLPARLQPA